MGRDQDRCAVVLGASMAGLLAARVLAERFATVVVVERDQLPVTTQHRRGVPQGKQIHALLAGGQRAFEELLPGLTAGLEADGAPVGDALADMRLCFGGHWFRRALSGLTLVHASRALLEHHVRSRVRCLPEVTVVDRCDVVGVAGSCRRIDGVRVLRHADNSAEEMLDADLVVDATGLRSGYRNWAAVRPQRTGLRSTSVTRPGATGSRPTRSTRISASCSHQPPAAPGVSHWHGWRTTSGC
jgi:2-polyprenyl-6-methoxyphenol hydroxylase-like FAD-dependent oxidoreductase